MNETLKLIKTRRSTKKFKSDMPPKEHIAEVVNAGLHAASGMNMQTPVIIAVADKGIRDRLMKKNASILGANKDPA